MRLDVYLQKAFPQLSRAMIQKLIKSGKVTINNVTSLKNGTNLKESDRVIADFDLDAKPDNSLLELKILHEDNDCVVIEKPLGVLTHSKGSFNPEPTVASWLSERSGFNFPEVDDDVNHRMGIVHRLDRATSGIMICAKNKKAQRHLQKQFQDRKAKKVYIARVQGNLKPEKAIIDLPIERNPKQPQRFRVGQNGKPSITNYLTLSHISSKRHGVDTLVEMKPLTGRTHQLRVHMHHLKHPIVGDTFYDGRKAKRLYLHAYSLEITLPSKKRETFTSNVPDEFNQETET